MEAPRLGVQSELQLPAIATATAIAMPEPSRVYHVHHSSWQRQILNSLSEARDRTHSLMLPSRIGFYCPMTGTPQIWNSDVSTMYSDLGYQFKTLQKDSQWKWARLKYWKLIQLHFSFISLKALWCVSELLPPQILHLHCHVLQKHTELKRKRERRVTVKPQNIYNIVSHLTETIIVLYFGKKYHSEKMLLKFIKSLHQERLFASTK